MKLLINRRISAPCTLPLEDVLVENFKDCSVRYSTEPGEETDVLHIHVQKINLDENSMGCFLDAILCCTNFSIELEYVGDMVFEWKINDEL